MRGGPGSSDPGRIVYENVTLQSILIAAYDLDCRPHATDCDQIFGPAWLRTEKFDIVARIPTGTTNDQFRLMLQTLMAERFHMTLHHQTKELAGYELAAGKTGPKLTKSPQADSTVAEQLPSGPPTAPKMGADGYPQLLHPGIIIAPHNVAGVYSNHLIAKAQTIADFTKMLRNLLAAHVVDHSGLTGRYDFTLDWIPGQSAAQDLSDISDGSLPRSIPAAVQEQFGLKLISKKLMFDTLIVDSADQLPVDN